MIPKARLASPVVPFERAIHEARRANGRGDRFATQPAVVGDRFGDGCEKCRVRLLGAFERKALTMCRSVAIAELLAQSRDGRSLLRFGESSIDLEDDIAAHLHAR